MRKNNQYYIRRVHRFLGVFIGVQFLLWTISGIYFSWTNIDEIHGDHFRQATGPVTFDPTLLSPAPLAVDEGIFALELKSVADQPCYWVNEKYLIDAQTGKLRAPITEEEAIAIAQKEVVSDIPVKRAVLIEEVDDHHEFRGKPLPAWQIQFEQDENLVAYVDARNGNFERVRYRSWRWFDALWMFHTMDYAGRDNFNNWLLRAFSLFGLATIGSGFTLYFVTKKRKPKRKK
ncbi:PepSY domain-containing protein [Algoriphagus namhaensis]